MWYLLCKQTIAVIAGFPDNIMQPLQLFNGLHSCLSSLYQTWLCIRLPLNEPYQVYELELVVSKINSLHQDYKFWRMPESVAV